MGTPLYIIFEYVMSFSLLAATYWREIKEPATTRPAAASGK
jgi:hypothetical protein